MRRIALLAVPLAVLGASIAGGSAASRVRATPGVFDPTVTAFDEPILDRLAGDDIPIDTAGLGGSMFDRLPQDERSAVERQIETEVVAALNWERAQRGLWPYTISERISATSHRWVRQLSSDIGDYPGCPVAVQGDPNLHSCDAALPLFAWSGFLNTANGLGTTLSNAGGGANAGAAAARAGSFVAGLLSSGGLHYADVLGVDARFAGVGVHCLADGRTFLVWNAVDHDTSYLFADPSTYQGPVVPAFTPTNFGRRCPQPGPDVTVSVTGSAASLSPIANTIKLTSGRHAIDGPVLGNDLSEWMIEVTLTHATAPVRVVSQPLYTPEFEFSPVVASGLAPGTWSADIKVSNPYESTQVTTTSFEVPAAPPSIDDATSGLRFTPITPVREIDTRQGARLGAGETRAFALDAPVGAGAVTMNVTAVHPVADGFLQVFPCGVEGVEVSSVNYTADLPATPNQVTVGLAGGELVCVTTFSSTDVLLDVAGWWSDAGSSFRSVPPSRLRDTRPAGVPAGGIERLDLDPAAPADATAVSLNVTSTGTAAAGFVTVWPCDDEMPTVSNLNPSPGVDRPNHVTVRLGSSRHVCVYTEERTDLVVDLMGWWTASAPSTLRVSTPQRVHDSRSSAAGRLTPDQPTVVLAEDDRTIVANVTVDRPAAAGWLAVFPCADGWSGSSNVNYRARAAASTAVLVDASRGGVCVLADQASDVIVDVFGEIT